MKKSIRYGDFLGVVRLKQRAVSYNELARAEHPARRPRLRALDVYRLVGPYVAPKAGEQLRAVLPIALFLALFQLLVLHAGVRGPEAIALGIVAVNIITAIKLQAVSAKADVIVGHVNSRETEYLGKIEALEKEKALLLQALNSSEKRAEMLAASTALQAGLANTAAAGK